MIVSFDKFEHFESPILTLCNPNSEATISDGKVTLSNTIGMLPDCKKVSLSPNFNSQWELSFEYPDNTNKQLHYIYSRLEKGRYIYVSDIGYFIIDDYSRHESDDRIYKSVSCHSIDKEIERNECPLLDEGACYFYTKDNQEGIIQKVMSLLPKWKLDFVSEDLKEKTAYFDGENDAENAYDFLWSKIEEAYECVIDVDFITRGLSFYSLEYYAAHHKTDIHLSRANDLREVVIESKDDDCFTAITVNQNDNLSLAYSNPNGSETLYNFDYCLESMSSELQSALEKWKEKYNATILPYRTLSEQWATALDDLTNAEKDLDILKEELNDLKTQRDGVINSTVSDSAKKTDLTLINNQISAKEQAITAQEAVVNTKKSNIQTQYEIPLNNYAKECSLELTAKDINGNLIFTQDLLNELSAYIKSAEYSDDYIALTDDMTYTEIYSQSNKLFDRAKSQLEKLSTQSYTFSVENNSFLFNKKFERYSKQLCPGAIVYLETSEDYMEQVHLTNFTIDYDEKNVSFTFGNKYDKNDIKSLFDDVFGSVKTSAAQLKYLKNIINDQRSELAKQRDWIDNAFTLTKDHILTSNNQAVIIDDSGYWGKRQSTDADGNLIFDTAGNPIYDNEQLKLINNGMYLTTDNWDSLATAVGKIYLYHDEETDTDVFKYGVSGEVIVGKMFLGKTLTLLGSLRDDGTYAITLNENGLTIINDGTTAGITIKDANGNKQFYADSDGNLCVSANITATSGSIGRMQLANWALFNIIDWIDTNGYVGYSCGMSTAFENATGRDVFLWVGAKRTSSSTDQASLHNAWIDEYKKYNWTTTSPQWGTFTTQENIKDSPFYVTWTGELHSSKGNIGGWTIDNNKIYSNGGNTYVASSGNYAFYSKGQNGEFHVGFYGDMYCSSANITGTVTATAGSVGGWQISDGRIYNTNSTTGYTFSLWNPAVAGGNIISCDNGSDYPFYVTRSGFLKANNAEITGKVTATSGSFTGTVKASAGNIGGWNITSGWLECSKSSFSIMLCDDGVIYSGGASPYSTSWLSIIDAGKSVSDKNLKSNIEALSLKADKFFDLLCPVSFTYKPEALAGDITATHFGFLAQDVELAYQEAGYDNLAMIWKEQYYNLNKQEIIALNTWQIQQLKKRIIQLEEKLNNTQC